MPGAKREPTHEQRIETRRNSRSSTPPPPPPPPLRPSALPPPNPTSHHLHIHSAVSSSIMIALIVLLFGGNDLQTLVAVFAANAGMCWCGLWMEQVNPLSSSAPGAMLERDSTRVQDWTPFIIGSLLGSASWIVVFLYFFGGGQYDNSESGGLLCSALLCCALPLRRSHRRSPKPKSLALCTAFSLRTFSSSTRFQST